MLASYQKNRRGPLRKQRGPLRRRSVVTVAAATRSPLLVLIANDPEGESEIHGQGEEVGQRHRPARRLYRQVGEVAEAFPHPLFLDQRDRGFHHAHQVQRPHRRNVVAKLDLELLDFGPREDVRPLHLLGLVHAHRDDELVLVPALPEVLLEKTGLLGLVIEHENEDPCLLGASEPGIRLAQQLFGFRLRCAPVAEDGTLAIAAQARVVEQAEAFFVRLAHLGEVEHGVARLHPIFIRVRGEHRLERFLVSTPLRDVLVAVDGVVASVHVYELAIAEAFRQLLELARADGDNLPVVVVHHPPRRVIIDVVEVLGAARLLIGLALGATVPIRDHSGLRAVLDVGARDLLVPPLVVLRILGDATPELGVRSLHGFHAALVPSDENDGHRERDGELPPHGFVLEFHQQYDGEQYRNRHRSPDDHGLLALLLEELDVVVGARGEDRVRLRGGDDGDLDLRPAAHEERAGEGVDHVVVLPVQVDELLLLAQEALTLGLDRDGQILVEADVEVGVGLLDPRHERAALVVAVAAVHDGDVDVLEAVLVLAGDLGLAGDHLPHGVVGGLVGFLLRLDLAREPDLGVAVGDGGDESPDADDPQDEGGDEEDFLGEVHGYP